MDDDMVHMLVVVAMCLHCRPRGQFMHMLQTAQDTNACQTSIKFILRLWCLGQQIMLRSW